MTMVWEMLSYICTLSAAALAGSAYVWYIKPGLIVKGLMRFSMYKNGGRVKFVRRDDRHYCYAERGHQQKDRSTLVLVHGFSASKDQWLGILQRLPKDLHIIMVDLPGHGNTFIPPGDISLEAFMGYLRECLQLIGLGDSNIHMVGTSMGGALVALYAATFPDHMEKLTVVCPAMRTPVTTPFLEECEKEPVEKCRLIPVSIEGVREMLNTCMYRKPKISNQFLLGILQLRLPKTDFYRRLFDAMNNEEGNMDMFLKKLTAIKAPTHVIWGKHDQLLHISGVDVLKERVPTIEQIDLFEECGHSVAMDRPGQLVKSILQFRGELPAPKDGEKIE